MPLAREELLPRVEVEDPGRLVSGSLLAGGVEPRVVDAATACTLQ